MEAQARAERKSMRVEHPEYPGLPLSPGAHHTPSPKVSLAMKENSSALNEPIVQHLLVKLLQEPWLYPWPTDSRATLTRMPGGSLCLGEDAGGPFREQLGTRKGRGLGGHVARVCS